MKGKGNPSLDFFIKGLAALTFLPPKEKFLGFWGCGIV